LRSLDHKAKPSQNCLRYTKQLRFVIQSDKTYRRSRIPSSSDPQCQRTFSHENRNKDISPEFPYPQQPRSREPHRVGRPVSRPSSNPSQTLSNKKNHFS
jgi:hypothetical protein